ncbi:MAG: mechanosensitive ion channel family protein [Leptonema sp. (in: bacteria)]
MQFIQWDGISQYLYLLFLTIVFFLLRILILNFIKKRIVEIKNFRIYKIYINYIFISILFLFYTPVFLPSIKEFITILSIFGAGVLLVFREVLVNFYSFFFILIRKPFQIGDRIQIQNFYGDVLDVRLQDFSMLQLYPQKYGGQSSGRVIHIPNSFILLHPIINFSKEFLFNWLEIRIPITLNSDWKKVEILILSIVNKILQSNTLNEEKIHFSKNEYSIHFSRLTPKTYVEFSNGAIVITVRFLCEPKKQRIFKDIFWREFLTKIKNLKNIHLHESYDNKIHF